MLYIYQVDCYQFCYDLNRLFDYILFIYKNRINNHSNKDENRQHLSKKNYELFSCYLDFINLLLKPQYLSSDL